MAIIQGLIAGVARAGGKILNTAFGWANVMLFGKVPKDRQIYLSIITFGSVIWIVVVIGVIFPSFGAWLLTFARLPKWVNHNWIRIAMFVAAVIIPPIVGFVALKTVDEQDRPKDAKGKALAILKGYPYTLGLAVTLIMLTIFAPVLWVRTAAKRWTPEHVPVVVEPDDYMTVVGDAEKALDAAGFKVVRKQASWMLRFPTRILTAMAGSSIKNLVAEKLTVLAAPNLEVTLHPSDLIVAGSEKDAARARAIVTEQLAFSPAYMTWDKEANQLEDRLNGLWNDLRAKGMSFSTAHAMAEIRRFEEDLRKTDVPFDEWDVLFREKLMVERAVLAQAAGLTDRPKEPKDSREAAPAPIVQGRPLSRARQAEPTKRNGHLPRTAAIAVAAILAYLGVRLELAHPRPRE